MHPTIEVSADELVAVPDVASSEATSDARADRTATVSSLHVPRADLERLAGHDWPLACEVAPGRIRLALADDGAPNRLLQELRGRGYGKAFLSLLEEAVAGGNRWLLIDDDAELDDKLLLFAG